MNYRLRSDGLAWQEVDGEIVCLDLTTSRYLAINATGATLWPLLVEGAEAEPLVAHLMSTFDIDAATATRDVSAFVGDLQERGLIDEA